MTAQIADLQISQPGQYGLAKSKQQVVLSPDWLTKANNVVIDSSGKPAARKGWALQNASAISGTPAIRSSFEYLQSDGTAIQIAATATKLYSSLSSPTDITGSVAFTTGLWQFVNFNGKAHGFQQGETPIVWAGTGNFADMTAATGSLPTGNAAVAAFGRIWASASDKQTIKYCALLDATKWDAADGAGLIDMRSVWTKGMDEIVALTAYGANLVVFGKRHIIMWTDGTGSELGLDPNNMYVAQSIENVGALARDLVCRVGEIDVAFWSASGIRTLVRASQEQVSPVNDATPENRDYLAAYATVGSLANAKLIYSPQDGHLLLLHPDSSRTFSLDLRTSTSTGALPVFEWSGFAPTAGHSTTSNALYFGFNGQFGLYSGYSDNGSAYSFELEFGWMDMPEHPALLKMFKRLVLRAATSAATVVTLKWWLDFGSTLSTEQRTIGATNASNEYGTGEYGIAEYGGASPVSAESIPLSRSGQFFRLGISARINGQSFGIHHLGIYYEPTRYA